MNYTKRPIVKPVKHTHDLTDLTEDELWVICTAVRLFAKEEGHLPGQVGRLRTKLIELGCYDETGAFKS